MRIGFLFNHDQIHQVAHSLPIALALADAGTGAEIIVATTSDALRAEVERIAGANIARGEIELVSLELTRGSSRGIAAAAEWLVPARKLLLYRDNLDFFRSLDVLVVAEKTSLLLKSRYGLDGLKIVHTRHGAGDRAIGFDQASRGFDHVLVSGAKIRDRLIAEAGVAAERISIVGYPKFDLQAATRAALPLDEERPVVLYNPHPSPHLSSWYRQGRAVLEWFAKHPEYQLIFAPHVMLFQRKFVVSVDKLRIDRVGEIPEVCLHEPHILVDRGSRASTDMSYTNRADIYLGDVSSQFYEYLVRPRPAVFLNTHRVRWEDDANFLHWQAGPVIEEVAQLGAALAEAVRDQEAVYRPVQERLFAASFDLTDEPSAVRAARAIARVAGLAR